jgi:hypothetical protein
MNKNILTVVGIIILFLGVGIQPAIAKVEPENIDTYYYDVNVEFCGLGKEKIVQLTKQQLDELEALFESIREQLNTTERKEKTIQIYNNAIERLDRIGLLGDYSVKQVQELVTGVFLNSRFNHLFNMLYGKLQDDDNTNSFCLIAGRTSNTGYIPPSAKIAYCAKIAYLLFLSLGYLHYIIFGLYNMGYLFLTIAGLYMFFILCRIGLYSLRPLNLGGGIILGYTKLFEEPLEDVPARGWIRTFGLSGQKLFYGSFIGQISSLILHLGVIGFKGIKIYNPIYERHHFLGFANYVNISKYSP